MVSVVSSNGGRKKKGCSDNPKGIFHNVILELI